MTELTVHQQTTTDLAQQMDYAAAVSKAGILPRAYQGNPGSVLIAMGLGSAMGLSPAESLYRIHVIEGKPSASAELIAANVRRAGHRLRVSGDARSATVTIIRADDPEFPFEVTWKIEDAQRAGLTGKGVWKSYPAAMLKARAITECARTACPEALYGVVYTDEELGGGSAGAERPAVAPGRAALVAAVAEPEAVEAEVVPEPDPAPTESAPMVTQQQLKKIAATMRDLGITEKAHALGYIEQAIGLKIASRSELTKAEAGRLIDALEEDVAHLPTAAEGDESFPNDTSPAA